VTTSLLQTFEEDNTEGVRVALSVDISDVDDDRIFKFMEARVTIIYTYIRCS